MGNRPDSKPNHQVAPQPILEKQGGGVAIDELEIPTWTIVLEDITTVAEKLRPRVRVRGRRAEPRIEVYAGEDLVGFVPIRESGEILRAMGRGATGLLGTVSSVDVPAGRVEVVVRLEGK